jgi:5-methylcytosine-specific restriction endonuclease McrA
MNKRTSYSSLERIKIAESAIEKGLDSASIEFDIPKEKIDKWVDQIDSLKIIREKILEKKKSATKTRDKKLRNTNVFIKISNRIHASVRKRGYDPMEKITPIQLWTIAKKQKCKCPISGIKLTRNNISVDHIIPLSKGGKNTLENIQYVERHVNIMKNDKSLEQFLFYCREIVKNNST